MGVLDLMAVCGSQVNVLLLLQICSTAYIYIYEIKQEPLISSLFLIIYLSHPRHVDHIMKIECFFLSTTDSLYSH